MNEIINKTTDKRSESDCFSDTKKSRKLLKSIINQIDGWENNRSKVINQGTNYAQEANEFPRVI